MMDERYMTATDSSDEYDIEQLKTDQSVGDDDIAKWREQRLKRLQQLEADLSVSALITS